MKRVLIPVLLVIAGGVLWAQNTVVLLNTQYNAESTGNVLTVPFTEWWPAGVVDATAYSVGWNFQTPATNGPSDVSNGSAGNIYPTLRFDNSASEAMNRLFRLPADWTGTLDLVILWQSATTTGNVVWQVATFCVADNENMDSSTWTYNAAQTVTDATQGSASYQNTASFTSLTTTGCAAGELLVIKVTRDPGHASDTMAGDADFLGAQFTYRRAI